MHVQTNMFFIMHLLPLQRIEYQREAAWYGMALFHLHLSWLEKLEDDAIMKKLLGLTLDVHIHSAPGSQEYLSQMKQCVFN